MKKNILVTLCCAFFLCLSASAQATDLLEVYQQALSSDPIFQQAISQRLATKQGVPINLAALLPNINLTAVPSVTRMSVSGNRYRSSAASAILPPRSTTQRAYNISLTATQTLFNYAQFVAVAGALATSKSADAILNAALQDLMIRVATAYFNILKDEDNLNYSKASKVAYAEQLDQAKQQYRVGLKTITDVYTAQASYDSANANFSTAQTTLANDRENLRVITGVYYTDLAKLSEHFPLVKPEPLNVDDWVNIALAQNWSIKSAQYTAEAAKQAIRQSAAGHLPTLNVQGIATRAYSNTVSSFNNINTVNGPGTETDKTLQLNFNLPIFAGGGVVAQTNQATYNYQVAQQQLEQTARSTVNTARQSYLSIVAVISQVNADKQTIKSTISSLKGLEASYQVGTQTLVDVLNQQQKVFQAQTQYATDRYAFVNNLLLLKQAAGTLSFNDLRGINAWLIEKHSRKK